MLTRISLLELEYKQVSVKTQEKYIVQDSIFNYKNRKTFIKMFNFVKTLNNDEQPNPLTSFVKSKSILPFSMLFFIPLVRIFLSKKSAIYSLGYIRYIFFLTVFASYPLYLSMCFQINLARKADFYLWAYPQLYPESDKSQYIKEFLMSNNIEFIKA